MPLFEDWADETLQSLSEDPGVPLLVPAYSRYELAYRKAFGLRYVLNPESGAVVVMDLVDKERTQRQLKELKTAADHVQARAAEIVAARQKGP